MKMQKSNIAYNLTTLRQLNKFSQEEVAERIGVSRQAVAMNTPPETVPLDRTNGAPRPLKWCVVTASMVH